MKHAVFATDHEHNRSRVTRWLDWGAAQDEWSKLDDKRRANPDKVWSVKFFEVRSEDDPGYNKAPVELWRTQPRPDHVKLTRGERRQLLKIGRRTGNLEDAADAMFTELMYDRRWEHLEAITVSDYAWGAAHFCFPHQIGW